MSKEELRKVEKEIDKTYKKHMKPLRKKQEQLKDEVEKEENEALIGKTFIYKRNSYSCPEKKSDYWDVYLKVLKVIKYGVLVLKVDKDSYGNIRIVTDNHWGNSLEGYEPCSKAEFERHFNKLLNEILELK